MFATNVMMSAGILAVSFAAGIGFYYLINTQTKQMKKQHIDELLSLVIRFIIYLWIAKVVLQLPLLLKSPMAVLAYPSNSTHFYLATVFCLIHTAIIFRKKLESAVSFFQSFSFIMLIVFLIYEFLLIVTNTHHHLNIYFVSLALIVLCYVLLYQKADQNMLAVTLFGGWLVLAGTISVTDGYFKLFQFMLKPYYFAALLLLLLMMSYFSFKKYKAV